MMTPQVRQWIYTAAAIATAIIPILVAYKVIDSSAAGAWVNFVGVLGALGSGGAATAAVMTAKQRHDGTLNFTGTAAEQAVAAIQATVAQASTAADELVRVKDAVSQVLNTTPELAPSADPAPEVTPGSLVEQLLSAVKPAE